MKTTYKTTYLTNYDLGYQFFLPKDNSPIDNKNAKLFFDMLDNECSMTEQFAKIKFEESKKSFYHCLRIYNISDEINAYFMSSGTVMLAIAL